MKTLKKNNLDQFTAKNLKPNNLIGKKALTSIQGGNVGVVVTIQGIVMEENVSG